MSDADSDTSYMNAKGLLLNPAKTQFILIRKPSVDIPDGVHLVSGNTIIQPSPTVKYLGILVDEHLSFAPQVDHVCKVVHQKVSVFRHGRRNLGKSAKRMFYLSIIQSTLEYASNSYVHSLSSTLYSKLIAASRSALKRIFGLDRITPFDLVLRHSDLYSLEQRFNLKLYCFVFRCLNGLTSPLLASLFSKRSQGSHTHSRTRGQTHSALVLPHARSRFGFYSVAFLGADRWNSLPLECRCASHFAEFVAHRKLYLGFPVRRQLPVGSSQVK